MLVSELLQAFLQPLPPPLAAFGGYFTFYIGKAGHRFRVWFHVLTRVAWFLVCAGEEPLPLYFKNSVKMRPHIAPHKDQPCRGDCCQNRDRCDQFDKGKRSTGVAPKGHGSTAHF